MYRTIRWGMVVSVAVVGVFYGVAHSQQLPRANQAQQSPLGTPLGAPLTAPEYLLQKPESSASNASSAPCQSTMKIEIGPMDAKGLSYLFLHSEGCIVAYTALDAEVTATSPAYGLPIKHLPETVAITELTNLPNSGPTAMPTPTPPGEEKKAQPKVEKLALYVYPKRCYAGMVAVDSLGGQNISVYSDDELVCEQLRAAGVHQQKVKVIGWTYLDPDDYELVEGTEAAQGKKFLKPDKSTTVTIGVRAVAQEW